jgi:hypothetical protein
MTNMTTDYRSLCSRLLRAVDSGNLEAEEHVLCQIRAAIKAEENQMDDVAAPTH